MPFAATSSGQLSEDAAAILFASLETAPSSDEPIRCLELGPGSGLFAKLLLDDLRRRCREHRRNYYDRITLVLADSSSAMLEAIAATSLLAEHEGHYELVHSDQPPARSEEGLRAVFLNYVLDSLPASVVRRTDTGIEHVCVRTCLAPDIALESYTSLSLTQVMELASAPEETSKRRLAEIYPALVVDVRYEPVLPDELPLGGALEGILPAAAGESVVHGHGAIACLHTCAERLTPGGFLLVNDFAYSRRDPSAPERSPYQVYGGALAIGLNFAQLEREADRWPDISVHAPGADEKLVSRLIGRDLDRATATSFAERFDPARLQARRAPRERAHRLIDEQRSGAARAALAEALSLSPGDWTLHEEAASFLAYVAKDRDAARTLACRGLELNPLAPGLWNVLGDCELHARRPRQALECFEHAVQHNPREVRGRYNAAYALTALRDPDGALRMIAEALALDDGSYRERILAKQARILERIARRREGDKDRIRDRARPWSS